MMTPAQWTQVRSLYETAVELAGEAQPAYVQHSCDDLLVRATVTQMLADRKHLAGFLETPLLPRPSFRAESSPATVGRRIGAYVLERELGRGGMGVVYLAARADDAYRKQVAIKFLWPGLPEDEKRFQRERQILADLDHPGIARLLDGNVTAEGWPYIVMEYVEGLPITEYCEQHWLDVTACVQLLMQVCAAVEYAHQQRVIHRDLKPANILVTADGTPRLLDFGIAKWLEADFPAPLTLTTQTGMRAMTPDYASPEQMRGEEITPASDVYSLGVLLYELLTGQRPFRLDDKPLHEAVRMVSEEDPVRPSARLATAPASALQTRADNPATLRTRLQGDLDNIVLKALHKVPSARYHSVAAFGADLERHLRHEPVQARQPTWRYRANRFVRRHRLGVALTSVVVLGLLVGLGGLLWRTQIARREAVQARHTLYLTQMQQAGRQLEQGGYAELRSLLTAWLPQPGQEDWRGWEWFYLWREAHRERLELRHEREVAAVAFAPDGKLIASASADATVRLWDRTTGQTTRIFRGHSAKVGALAFAPHGDLIASAGEDQQLRLWDVVTGEERWQVRIGGTIEYTVAFAPNGEQIAVGTDDALIMIQAKTGERVFTVRQPNAILQVAFFPDGRQLATAGQDEQLKVWETGTGKLLRSVRAHPGSYAFCVAVSPDGRSLATGGNDAVPGGKAARLWDATTLREIRVLAQHTNAVRGVAFAPDSKRLVTVGADQQVIVWDVTSGQAVQIRGGHTNRIRAVAFAPDGRDVASGSDDHTVKVWNVDAATEPADVLTGHQARIMPAAISPDGKLLATGSADTTVKLWEIATGRERATLRGHPGDVFGLAFAPHEPLLLTGTTEATIKSWDTTTGEETGVFATSLAPLAFTVEGHPMQALQRGSELVLQDLITERPWLTFSGCPPKVIEIHRTAKGQQLFTITEQGLGTRWEVASQRSTLTWKGDPAGFQYLLLSADGRVAVTEGKSFLTEGWEMKTGQRKWSARHGNAQSGALQLARDGRFLLTGGPGNTAQLVNPRTGQPLATLTGHTAPVSGGAFAADGQRLATLSANGELKLWDVPTKQLLRTFATNGDRLNLVAFLPDGQRLVTAGVQGEVRWWDLATGAALDRLPGHDKGLVQMMLAPDASQLLARDLDGGLFVRDLTTRQRRSLPGGMTWNGAVQALAVSPDGNRLAVAHWRVVSLLELARRQQTLLLEGHQESIWAVSFSPDGKRLATAAKDNTARIWDATTGHEVAQLTRHPMPVTSVAFSPDGNLLATGSEDRTIKLWNVGTGREIRTLAGHTDAVRGVAFSADGRRLASASVDKTVRVWDVETGLELLTLRGHTDEVWSVAFTPDGQTLVSGSWDKTARLWRAASDLKVNAQTSPR